VNPEFVHVLEDAMRRNPTAAFIGPMVYFRERGVVQRTCLPFPSALRSALTWLPFHLAPGLLPSQPTVESDVDFLNGVCVLCRTEALLAVGLMDEAMGAYVEDTDWAWRARKGGWKSRFVPVPSLIHHEEPHGYEHHSFKTFLLKRNTVYWMLKAGKPVSARAYAAAAVLLAQWRTFVATSREAREASRKFAQDLGRTYRRLLAGEVLGPWFGPPLGSQRSEEADGR
jgi:GT2 family glycosyltransferase